jgi:hypothetical protein
MSRKMYFAMSAIAVVVVIFAVRGNFTAQSKNRSTSSPVPWPMPKQMSLHGHTRNPDDLEHCFIRDSGSAKRPLYFDTTLDVPVQYDQIGLKLYTFATGEPKEVAPMKKTQEWDAPPTPGKAFTIIIKEDKLDSHLGPGPYMAAISMAPLTDVSAPKFVGYYYYGTRQQGASPGDCWAH